MGTIIRGNVCRWTIPILNTQGAPFPLFGCAVFVTYKSSVSQPDDAALFRHSIVIDGTGTATSSDGMKLGPGGASAGVIVERLSPLESVTFAAGTYVYDVQVVIPNPDDPNDPDVYTPIIGDSDTVSLDVTRSVTP